MEEHEGKSHLGGVEAGPVLVELPGPLDLEHQVPPINVLHHEEEAVLCGDVCRVDGDV